MCVWFYSHSILFYSGGSHLWVETGCLSYYGLGHKILDYSVAVDVKRNIPHCPEMPRTCHNLSNYDYLSEIPVSILNILKKIF